MFLNKIYFQLTSVDNSTFLPYNAIDELLSLHKKQTDASTRSEEVGFLDIKIDSQTELLKMYSLL